MITITLFNVKIGHKPRKFYMKWMKPVSCRFCCLILVIFICTDICHWYKALCCFYTTVELLGYKVIEKVKNIFKTCCKWFISIKFTCSTGLLCSVQRQLSTSTSTIQQWSAQSYCRVVSAKSQVRFQWHISGMLIVYYSDGCETVCFRLLIFPFNKAPWSYLYFVTIS